MTKQNSISSEKNEPVIAIRGLEKKFGKLTVLSDLDLDLFSEENLVVLGKSGTGKSVLIKLIVALFPADRGSINVLGQDVITADAEELAAVREKIGFLFQGGALYDSMTVEQNLRFPLQRIKKEKDEKKIQAKISEVLENVGLPDVLKKMPSELSGGQRKRIALARTIVVDPQIILYDEPTTGLDPVTSNEISDLILEIQKEYKTSSIIITHDIACARKVADRLVMLGEGKVYKEGSVADFDQSEDQLIRSFFNPVTL